VLAGSWEDRVPAVEREWATAAAVALAVAQGADILRLHDRTALDAMRVADRVSDLGAEQRVRSTRVRRDRQVRGDS
jgi:dihydropteroate synthase